MGISRLPVGHYNHFSRTPFDLLVILIIYSGQNFTVQTSYWESYYLIAWIQRNIVLML